MLETPIEMYRGDTFVRTFSVIQDGAVFDLTGCTIRMTFKWALSDLDASAVFTLYSPSSGITSASPSTGEFTFTIGPSNTSSLPPRTVRLYYDAQVTTGASKVYTVASGKLTILADSSITTP